MHVRFTKLNDQRHVFEVERDGRVERAELETRSTLYHDFTHFAVEEAARISGGFFGSLATGATFADLREEIEGYSEFMMRVEGAVAFLQSLAKVDRDPADMYRSAAEAMSHQGRELPPWFTESFVADVREKLRRLIGHWKATPFGETMEIEWEQPD